MNASLDHHYPEEIWENYAMGALSDQEAAPLEEHLLICNICQDLLARADEYIEVAKAALAPAQDSDPGGPPVRDHRNRRRLSKAVGAAANLT
jgi:hypothetical protein